MMRTMQCQLAALEARIEDSDEAMQTMQCNMKDKDDYVAVLELRVETMEQAMSDLQLLNHAKTDAQERNEDDYIKVHEVTDVPLVDLCKVGIADDANDIPVRLPHDMGRALYSEDIRYT